MMRYVCVAAFASGLLMLDGCASCENMGQQFRSATVGIKRKVTLYSANGTIIKEWTMKGEIEDSGSMIYFVDDFGHPVLAQGTLVAEEIVE